MKKILFTISLFFFFHSFLFATNIAVSKFKTAEEKFKYEYDMGNTKSGYKYAKLLFDKEKYEESGKILTALIMIGEPAESFTLMGVFFDVNTETLTIMLSGFL